ncbi:hypothetical protein ABID80_005241, partial [Streptomyces sp. PvP037]|uniref:hypothetical protein n=1 Tax=Streptomyces sp. PvP037 TaxID=3156437 RepID=UPI0033942B60
GVDVLGLARLSRLEGAQGADAPATAGDHPRPAPSAPYAAAPPALRGQSCRWGGTGGRDGTP